VRSGLFVPNFGTFADPRAVAGLAAAAEAAGWDGLFVWDHVVRHEGDLDVADPWILLAAAGLATERLVLGPLVTPLPRRRPWNVARAITTLDLLTGGRMVLGVGLGSPRGPEFAPFGEETDLKARGDLLDEGLAIITAAWTGRPVHHRGPRLPVDGISFLPRPVRPGGIPVWAATERVSGRAVRRAAGLGGIFPIGLTPAELVDLRATVTALRPTGTGPFDIVVVNDRPEVSPAQWRDAGATWLLQPLAWDRPMADSAAVAAGGPPAT
jgi:alkanesulfonate monooxygenase SsuD/methylene tetrahydromethanopterin reductase-like flavin-dependent oxidoreductase (luciferase family)